MNEHLSKPLYFIKSVYTPLSMEKTQKGKALQRAVKPFEHTVIIFRRLNHEPRVSSPVY